MRIDLFFLTSLASIVLSAPTDRNHELQARQNTERLVFAHFMIGITANRHSAAEYDYDMQRAKDLGIDAFALNIGKDPYTDEQLNYAYESAAKNDMKVFISFDFNWYKDSSEAPAVGSKVKQYASLPAQLKVDNKVFVSSFAGDKLDVGTVRQTAGIDLFIAPNWNPEMGTDLDPIDGAFNWMAWPSDGNNRAPKPGKEVTVEQGDQAYIDALGGKPYIAPVSPWFFTHFDPEVSYSKDWVFPGDLLWYDRWNQVLTLGPRFVEIVTWNDYGESHYIGPLSSKHTDDGASKWVNDMPHDGWMDMAKPYIAAYHAGAKSVNDYIKDEQIIYWYRPTLRSANCSLTDTTIEPDNNQSENSFNGRPDGWESVKDAVFVVALLKSDGEVSVNSGDNTNTFNSTAGASAFSVDMGVESNPSHSIVTDKKFSVAPLKKDISNACPCGLYNFNAFVGTIPPGKADSLDAEGLQAFSQGLKVATCQPT